MSIIFIWQIGIFALFIFIYFFPQLFHTVSVRQYYCLIVIIGKKKKQQQLNVCKFTENATEN